MFQVTTDDVAQLAHVGWGGFMVLGFALYFPIWLAILLAVVISFGKEASESIWGGWEAIQPWASGMRDFGFFVVGIGAAVVLMYVAHLITSSDTTSSDTYIF